MFWLGLICGLALAVLVSVVINWLCVGDESAPPEDAMSDGKAEE